MYSRVATVPLEGPTAGLCWSPDGRHLALAVGDTLRLVEIERASEFVDLPLPAPASSEPFWGPDSENVVVPFGDGSVGMWSHATGERLPLECSSQNTYQKPRWSPDGAMLAGVVGSAIGIWDNYRNPPKRLLQAVPAMSVIEWSHRSETIAAAGRGAVMLWNSGSGALKRRLADAPADTTALAWSPDGDLIAAAARAEATVHVWEVSTGNVTALLRVDGGGVLSVSFSSCGTWLACTMQSGETSIWTVRDWVARQFLRPASVSGASGGTSRFSPVAAMLAVSEPQASRVSILRLDGGPVPSSHTRPAPQAKRLFVSYARQDRQHVKTLLMHLGPLKAAHELDIFADHGIQPGASWNDEIRNQLDTADIVLLLVSAAFLDSRYICQVELKRALERRSQGLAIVVPILLQACDWERTELHELNALPDSAKPISQWHRRADAYQNVVKGLSRVVGAPYSR
jgi:hypothetical protein